jgi:DNA primase
MVIRNGEKIVLKDVEDENGNLINMSVAQYIEYNLSVDDLSFENETFRNMLQEAADQCAANDDFKAEQYFVHHHDINISKIATALSVDKYLVIEKPDANDNLYTEEEKEEEERAKLLREADHLLNDFRLDYLNKQVEQLQNEIKQCSDLNQSLKLIPQLNELKTLRNSFALKVVRA